MRLWWVLTWETTERFSLTFLPGIRITRNDDEWEICLEWLVLSCFVGIGGGYEEEDGAEDDPPMEQEAVHDEHEDDEQQMHEDEEPQTETETSHEPLEEETTTHADDDNTNKLDKDESASNEFVLPPSDNGEFSFENLTTDPKEFRRIYHFD